MAWTTVATTNLGDSSGTYGYVYLQYDSSSTGTSRSSRLRFEIKSGCSIYVYIDGLALDGSSVKSRFLCQGTMNFWTGNLAAGTRKFTWSCPWYSGTRSYTCSGNIPSGVVAPSGLSVTLSSKTYNSATFATSISSYGTPASTSGRYIEAAILGQNSYGASYRYSIAKNTTSSTITVNNSSSANPSTFNIEGNHQYWYGGYASNTQANTSKVVGSFYTPCPPLSTLAFVSQTYSAQNKVNAVISYTRQADGGAETRTGYYRYSTDGGTNYSAWTSFGTISADAGTTATFNVSLPTSSSVTLQAKINTPNGGDSEIKTTSFTTLVTHTAPTFSNFEYEDINPATVALTGNNQTMIQGQSTPQITISTQNKAIGNDGINVSNYAITFTGQSKVATYSSDSDVKTTLNAPNDSGSCNLTVAAVDAISTSTAVSKSVTVYPWSAPTISAAIERVNNFESDSVISVSGTFSPIDINNVAKNTLTLEYRAKKSSSSEWNAWVARPVIVANSTWSVTDFTVVLDNNYQWDIQIRITDAFTNIVADLSLPVGMPNFFIGSDGRVSVGMKPEKLLNANDRGHLEVSGAVYSRGSQLMPSHIGQIIMSTTLDTAVKVQEVYGGTWTAWGSGRVPVGVNTSDTDFATVQKTGGEKTHTLSAAEMPKHKHNITFYNDDFSNGGDSGQSFANKKNSPGLTYDVAYMQGAWTYSQVSETGSSSAHNNLQPYITCYMWQRTA